VNDDATPRYRPGVEVATTPGSVVHRSHLVDLIQYLPMTATVQREPVLCVPSWIMKYYILDLSPHNSLVRWLVDQGHTVFMLGWRNPDESDALLSMQDYVVLGLFEPLAVMARRLPDTPVHACGYCLGGTLLSLAAAAQGAPGSSPAVEPTAPLASVTLLAAETDFSEPGPVSRGCHGSR
jgi:polyhydroxyalkanoate synthase subunit PhaC